MEATRLESLKKAAAQLAETSIVSRLTKTAMSPETRNALIGAAIGGGVGGIGGVVANQFSGAKRKQPIRNLLVGGLLGGALGGAAGYGYTHFTKKDPMQNYPEFMEEIQQLPDDARADVARDAGMTLEQFDKKIGRPKPLTETIPAAAGAFIEEQGGRLLPGNTATALGVTGAADASLSTLTSRNFRPYTRSDLQRAMDEGLLPKGFDKGRFPYTEEEIMKAYRHKLDIPATPGSPAVPGSPGQSAVPPFRAEVPPTAAVPEIPATPGLSHEEITGTLRRGQESAHKFEFGDAAAGKGKTFSTGFGGLRQTHPGANRGLPWLLTSRGLVYPTAYMAGGGHRMFTDTSSRKPTTKQQVLAKPEHQEMIKHLKGK